MGKNLTKHTKNWEFFSRNLKNPWSWSFIEKSDSLHSSFLLKKIPQKLNQNLKNRWEFGFSYFKMALILLKFSQNILIWKLRWKFSYVILAKNITDFDFWSHNPWNSKKNFDGPCTNMSILDQKLNFVQVWKLVLKKFWI